MSKPIPSLHSSTSGLGLYLMVLLLFASGSVDALTAAPQNLGDFYSRLRSQTKECKHRLATGFHNTDDSPGTTSYCGNHQKRPTVIWLQGREGTLSNMDIDCDGVQGGTQDDGRCSLGRSPDYQDATAFRDVVTSYNLANNMTDLNTYVHPYVVFGNSGTKKKWKTFDPERYGIKPLSVMAVVCGVSGGEQKLVYGIWGDTNGDDGDKPVVGETSIALATACYGQDMSGDVGYDGEDVLYLAFAGDEAVPGPNGADWAATDFEGFERSIKGLGDRLVAKIVVGDSKGVRRDTVSVVMFVVVFLSGIWIAI